MATAKEKMILAARTARRRSKQRLLAALGKSKSGELHEDDSELIAQIEAIRETRKTLVAAKIASRALIDGLRSLAAATLQVSETVESFSPCDVSLALSIKASTVTGGTEGQGGLRDQTELLLKAADAQIAQIDRITRLQKERNGKKIDVDSYHRKLAAAQQVLDKAKKSPAKGTDKVEYYTGKLQAAKRELKEVRVLAVCRLLRWAGWLAGWLVGCMPACLPA